MEDWLIKNKHRLSIRAIEKEIGCPASTLSKVANGNIKLPGKWRKKLEKVARDLKWFDNTPRKWIEHPDAGEFLRKGEYRQTVDVENIVVEEKPPINPPSKPSPFDIPIEELKKKYNGW